jgi:hypothetical protein
MSDEGGTDHLPLWQRILCIPVTQPGIWAVSLIIVACGLFALLRILFITISPAFRDALLSSGLWIALRILLVVCPIVAGGVLSVVAIVRKGERSGLIFLMLLVGVLIVVFLIAQLIIVR